MRMGTWFAEKKKALRESTMPIAAFARGGRQSPLVSVGDERKATSWAAWMEPPKTPKDTEKACADTYSRSPLLHENLTKLIRQSAFEVHRYFGGGFLEAVYRGALRNRLRKQGLDAAPCRFTIRDEDGTVVGVYEADLVVERKVVVELKAASGLRPEHVAQTLNYLKAAGLRVGLLINFGSQVLQVRRLIY